MLYCIYIDDGFRPGFSYNGRDKAFVDSLVSCYLKGEGEKIIDGINYGLGAQEFQIYQTDSTDSLEIEALINTEQALHHFGHFSPQILEHLFKNVTTYFLRGRKWADLKEELYNVYLNVDGSKKIKTTVEKDELLKFIDHWQTGASEGWLEGTRITLINPIAFKIYDIHVMDRKESKGETKKHINQQLHLLYHGKWTTRVLEQFGKEVTSEFKIEPFGSRKKFIEDRKTEKEMTNKIKEGKIFISHSSKDLTIVNKFIDSILILGLGLRREQDIFCTSADGTAVKSGTNFKEAIKNELINAKAVIQIITKNYKSSEVCLNEMGAAWIISERVIPLIATPFNYDVGFIHASSAQLLLNKSSDLVKFVDDHMVGLVSSKINLANYNRQVEEFVEFMSRVTDEPESQTDTRFFFDEIVSVKGILKEDIFQHPNGTHHRYYYIKLIDPVDVLSNKLTIDEGNFNTSRLGITKLHITPKDAVEIDLKQFKDKQVLVIGSCWGGYTAWHQSEVMMSFQNISISNK